MASLERRQAMSTGGKKAIQSPDRIRTVEGVAKSQPVETAATAPSTAPATGSTTEKKGCGCGCDGTRAECKTQLSFENRGAGDRTGSHFRYFTVFFGGYHYFRFCTG
jgi:hypothetical protein